MREHIELAPAECPECGEPLRYPDQLERGYCSAACEAWALPPLTVEDAGPPWQTLPDGTRFRIYYSE